MVMGAEERSGDDAMDVDTNADELVLSYLTSVLTAINALCDDNDKPHQSSPEILIEQIARKLLEASFPERLNRPLPESLQNHLESLPVPDDDLTENGEINLIVDRRVPTKRRRIDYLASIVRGMAPIAMDVAANACLLVTKDTREPRAALACFFLFSVWLPIAPQITPMVSDLFALETFPSPLDTLQDMPSNEAVFLVAEASHAVCAFFAERRQHITLERQWWDWGPLLSYLGSDDDMEVSIDWCSTSVSYQRMTRWHAARAVGHLMNMSPVNFAEYLRRMEVYEPWVPWVLHQYIVEDEAHRQEIRSCNGRVALLHNDQEIPAPTSEEVRQVLPVPPMLAHVGEGIVLCKRDALRQLVINNPLEEEGQSASGERRRLVMTPTTARNLSLVGAALCQDPFPPPILVCGPPGSGKSSLVREMVQQLEFGQSRQTTDRLLEIHVDEETDSKTLIGSYTTTDIPGEFTWQPGALTRAVREGKWVLMEDLDCVPMEIQATLVQLLENRLLPLGGGKTEACHPNFRLFGTCATHAVSKAQATDKRRYRLASMSTRGRRILSPNLWTKVHVEPLTLMELLDVSKTLHPSVPASVMESALQLYKAISQDDSMDPMNHAVVEAEPVESMVAKPRLGRTASARDFLKLMSRISRTVVFERAASYATEAQRTLCLAESFDIFAANCAIFEEKRSFLVNFAAPAWGITADLALQYVEARKPEVVQAHQCTNIGRAKLPLLANDESSVSEPTSFAPTNYSLRLMESIAVGVAENESILLVGETGCGKTTVVQQLARLSGYELVVQNLSLQTDSTDLLGGYRPLDVRQIARTVYLEFVDVFVSSFSRKQNKDFLDFTSSAFKKGQWKKLSQCFRRASKLGHDKIRAKRGKAMGGVSVKLVKSWENFSSMAERFERQRLACDSGLAFSFTEGVLVDAIRTGKWVLLDEINLASSETLQRLCGLLDDASGSVTLTERGDVDSVRRHPNFRLFAAMNPATDAGKKDLPVSIRSRFTELYVDEMTDPGELRKIAGKYLVGVVSTAGKPVEHSESAIRAVETYLKCRELAVRMLVDANGHRPRYTLRTLCRALVAAKSLVVHQKFDLKRGLLEGFMLAFEGPLDAKSATTLRSMLRSSIASGKQLDSSEHPGRRPGGRNGKDAYALVKPFWIKTGPEEPEDWSLESSTGRPRFILTKSMSGHLRRIARAVSAGPWPILLEGPTSAGKTSLVEYLAARCGHKVIRINNHEHTDVQEYTGAYAADEKGSLSFKDGILVQALRNGHWIILDELNLAPSEVLEALNRLLDDNRELFLPEVNEVVKPHPDFRLFATQNPSGAYGGRKPLSRAFRNRFVEIHLGDIPPQDLAIILERRCECPSSHAKLLVKTMTALRQRRSKAGVFLGKDGLITPRDLLRWAERRAPTKLDLAQEGYMILGERLRGEDEKNIVREEIERNFKVTIDMNDLYFGPTSEARVALERCSAEANQQKISVVPTRSMLRLLTLVLRCVRQREPVLLVGDTGCGKTTVVQLLSVLLHRELLVVNCHATTETSDLIGGLRPMRGREATRLEMISTFEQFRSHVPEGIVDKSLHEEAVALSATFHSNSTEEISQQKTVDAILSLAKRLWNALGEFLGTDQGNDLKRRKVANGDVLPVSTRERMEQLLEKLAVLHRRHGSLFEWVDGPLVQAMQHGHLLLLDEMSLAEDAVIERLNSVLEPSRTLVLAEKGGDDVGLDSFTVKTHDDFLIFATMNPGGDFGKRELSPALRSRFTEIWVPAVDDISDVALVVKNSFSRCAISEEHTELVDRMLAYVKWFNHSSLDISGGIPFTLSLRDVISWSNFIAEVSSKNNAINIWEIFCHGAALMHLDGLGLGTGLAREDAVATRAKAMKFLLQSVAESVRHPCEQALLETKSKVFVSEERFGIHPFSIPLGSKALGNTQFNFDAPTTSINLSRVLRAMQLSKPILLEGSPGVGKTSLIASLAEASGNDLVRINLSEQTDITDLMGTDLPTPEDDHDESGASSGPTFEWCDGVLLRAIKEGKWVLLDELNLASQSVLEGLNSCLDHRASVYIPELGQSFECPPTFRVFAAQNPLAQGGGRKGLPKSFLNRFTKVYVEPLTRDDLLGIVSSCFPSISSVVEPMVDFNTRVHRDVVEEHAYGVAGSPWEFNLRDIFRWCELCSSGGSNLSVQFQASVARDLYAQRFRSSEDRARVALRFEEFAKIDGILNEPQRLDVQRTSFHIGDTVLSRHDDPNERIDREEPSNDTTLLFRALWSPLEAAARCVAMSWPCLLVGTSCSGKSTVVKSLADLSNKKLVQIGLAPSSDVNELLGGFEQVDAKADQQNLVSELRIMQKLVCQSMELSSHSQQKQTSECFRTLRRLEDLLRDTVDGVAQSTISVAKAVLQQCRSITFANSEAQERMNGFLSRLHEFINEVGLTRKGKSDGRFRWVDGILVEAMVQGHWLLLENVNLCSSSVLDRLNPVLERGGELLLAENGSQEGGSQSSHRTIKPHRSFRVFLTMNPEFGEVSRAMRNRCVEIFVDHADPTNTCDDDGQIKFGRTTMDMFDLARACGLRSMKIASNLLTQHVSDVSQSVVSGSPPPGPNSLPRFVTSFKSLEARGIGRERRVNLSSMLAFELLENGNQLSDRLCFHVDQSVSLVKYPRIRVGSAMYPEHARLQLGSRLLHILGSSRQLSTLPCGLDKVQDCGSILPSQENQQSKAPVLYSHDHLHWRRTAALLLFFGTARGAEGDYSGLFHRYDRHISQSLRTMNVIRHSLGVSEFMTSSFSSKNEPGVPTMNAVILQLLEMLLHHQEFTQQERGRDPEDRSVESSVLEVSFRLAEGNIESDDAACPVTPSIYPLLDLLLRWVREVVADPLFGESNCLSELSSMLRQIDQMWHCVFRLKHQSSVADFLHFDSGAFLVQWRWLTKSIFTFRSKHSPSLYNNAKELESLEQRVDLVVQGVKESVFEGGHYDVFSRNDVLWKRGGHPCVPFEKAGWDTLFDLRQSASLCTILNDQRFSGFRDPAQSPPIGLAELVESLCPSLFVQTALKGEILGGLCMVYFRETKEMAGLNFEVPTLNFRKLALSVEQLRREFGDKWKSFQIDFEIDSVDNRLDAEDLVRLRDQLKADVPLDGFLDSLLKRFADVQISPIVELWCTQEEQELINAAMELILRSRTDDMSSALSGLASRMRRFIGVALESPVWPLSYLRPFQTLLWACESDKVPISSFRHLFLSLVHVMLSQSLQHFWCNTFNHLSRISDELNLPVRWEQSPVDQSDVVTIQQSQSSPGPCRTWKRIRTEFIFKLVGVQFSNPFLHHAKPALHTIENHHTRQYQVRKSISHLSNLVLSSSCKFPTQAHFLFANAVEAFCDDFDSEDYVIIRDLISDLASANISVLLDLLKRCKNRIFISCVDDLLRPLISSLSKVSKNVDVDENRALCWVFVGLLRVHLVTPSSPLDPGLKPIAKVEQYNLRLQKTHAVVQAYRVGSGLVSGDFNPDFLALRDLQDESRLLGEKRKKQSNKKVERPSTAAPFVQLYRDVHRFKNAMTRLDVVRPIVSAIQQVGKTPSAKAAALKVESSWQNTAGSFCQRLRTRYRAYEDVTMPFLVAVGCVQRGFRELLECFVEGETHDGAGELFDSLLTFPIASVSLGSGCVHHPLLVAPDQPGQLLKRYNFAVSVSSLARGDVQRRARGLLTQEAANACTGILFQLVRAWIVNVDGDAVDQSDHEADERMYREQFPDHNKAFTGLRATTPEGLPEDEMDEAQPEREDDEPSINLSTEQLRLLYTLHRDLFANGTFMNNDSSRLRAFQASYGAAHMLRNLRPELAYARRENESIGVHVLALALSSNGSLHSTFNAQTSKGVAFHTEPNPSEVVKACSPLRLLMTRTSQLLTAFPGHSILLAIGQAAEHVSKLDLSTTSVGKAMTGLELILRKAQEWEQHASARLKFGVALQEISQLIANWRRLELSSWPQLLSHRENLFVRRSIRHWMRLYSAVHAFCNIGADYDVVSHEKGRDAANQCWHKWLWKGLDWRRQEDEHQPCTYSSDQLKELTKLLDTFILTSSLGEFHERLAMLDTFANQFALLSREKEAATTVVVLARVLRSSHSYYGQFGPSAEKTKQSVRAPLEKRLKDEVKLAKWDQQSFYALVESTEKNHRKLMKVLREYDDALERPFSSIVEDQLCLGVGGNSGLEGYHSSEFPSDSQLFPFSNDAGDDNLGQLEPRLINRTWTTSTSFGVELRMDNHLSRLKQYAKKISKFSDKRGESARSWSLLGEEAASSLCDGIFSRIESLRSKKTAKQMKQRALVDLLKVLKAHGFKGTKWSTPPELRDTTNLFTLHPLFQQSSLLGPADRNVLNSADAYYNKVLSELNRLRSETSISGSKYMSQREMQLMTSLGDHFLLFVCQQRQTTIKLLQELERFHEITSLFPKLESGIPSCQDERQKHVKSFNDATVATREVLSQLRLSLATIAPHAGDRKAMVHDVATGVDGCVSLLDEYDVPTTSDVATTQQLLDIGNTAARMKTIVSNLASFRRTIESQGGVPTDLLDPCFRTLNFALEAASKCTREWKQEASSDVTAVSYKDAASSAVETILLSAQRVTKAANQGDTEVPSPEGAESLWEFHRLSFKELGSFGLVECFEVLEQLKFSLLGFHDGMEPEEHKRWSRSVAVDISVLAHQVSNMALRSIREHMRFHRSSIKLHYVILRVFRVLVSKGFCGDEMSDESDGNGDGNASGMTFEDEVDGTGMGDGEGKKDVTDEIENEEQLLGLKNEENAAGAETERDKPSQQLDEEEANQGMEMEGDFEGDTFDVPDEFEQDDQDNSENEEDVDREMGDGTDPMEEVIDEKMWGESDEEEEAEGDREEEKFERDSKVKGDALEDEMRTKEEGDESPGETQDEERPESGAQEDAKETDKEINEDTEENYEDKHAGVDVRDESNENPDNDEEFDVDNDLDLDANETEEGDEEENENNIEGLMEEEAALGEGVDDNEPEDDENVGDDQDSVDGEAEPDSSKQDVVPELAAEEKADEDDAEMEPTSIDQPPSMNHYEEEAYGTKSKEGADKVGETHDDEPMPEESQGRNDGDDQQHHDESSHHETSGQSTSDVGNGTPNANEPDSSDRTKDPISPPNPLKNLGDAKKFWHKKLNIVDEADEEEEAGDLDGDNDEDDKDGFGEYELSERNTTQALAETAEEDPVPTEDRPDDEADEGGETETKDHDLKTRKDNESNEKEKQDSQSVRKNPSKRAASNPAPANEDMDKNEDEDEEEDEADHQDDDQSDVVEPMETDEDESDDNEGRRADNRVVADLAQLDVVDDPAETTSSAKQELVEDEDMVAMTTEEMSMSRSRWGSIQSETYNLSRQLCEKLRLVMEPLVATKLKGDYRTGKRINMKRVIGYIASGFRKDKIWLRRTKPAKRNYRVLLAVDNSESMKKSGAGDMALAALATMANGMSQLEIGELAVASFGEEMRILHPFDMPFTSQSGAGIVHNFPFTEQRTRTALCVESALCALSSLGDPGSMQLVFLISDGRIERDSRTELRRLMREMVERNILLVMIVVEGKDSHAKNSKQSIVHMKEVTFENGKPNVKQFIEDYPFPYYIILQDMQTLPEVLGDALRQWFEMIAQLQDHRL